MPVKKKDKYAAKIEVLKEWLTDLDNPRSVEALEFAVKSHKGQFRKPVKDKVPYINHPVNMVYHALSLGIENDDVIAAILLHDVVEDCGVALEDLPCSKDTRRWVGLLTKNKDNYSADEYYAAIAADPKASLIKCLDRVHNLSEAAYGFRSVKKVRRYAEETRMYYDPLIQTILSYPFAMYRRAAWLLNYQMLGLVRTIMTLTEPSSAVQEESARS